MNQFAISLFYVFAATAVLSAASLMVLKNILHAAFMLIVSFVSIAAVFVFAGADFLAITQIMVYVGGILVLVLFGIMLTWRNEKYLFPASGNRGQWLGWASAAGLFALVLSLILKINFPEPTQQIQTSTIHTLGISLMSDYVIAFELAGVLLMVALMGAASLAAEHKQND